MRALRHLRRLAGAAGCRRLRIPLESFVFGVRESVRWPSSFVRCMVIARCVLVRCDVLRLALFVHGVLLLKILPEHFPEVVPAPKRTTGERAF